MVPRGRSARRALLLITAVALVAGSAAAGLPPLASAGPAAATEATPAPTAPPEPDPIPVLGESPTPPADPASTEPAPTDPASESPAPPASGPPVPPASENPAPPVGPVSGGVGPGAVGPLAPNPAPMPAPGFGLVYPTNPWVYTAESGTRFLDPRESSGGLVVRRHMGIDAQGGVRQPVFAVADGTVVDGTWGTTRADRHGFGNQLVIAHADGYTSRYAHLAEPPLVPPGAHVSAGQLIGYMGGSQRGDLAGVPRHLHFEVTKDGRNIDPIAFLAGATAPAATGGTAPAAAPAAFQLYEIRPAGDGYASTATGVAVGSEVFTAVATGPDSAQILVCDSGTLRVISGTGGTWTTSDTGLALDATSISGVSAGGDAVELLAVENGRLLHITGGPGGWTKTWTGHYFSGTVSAVRLPGGELHALMQQAGYLYHLQPADGGLWNVTDTGLTVGGQIDAAYVGGSAPEAMTIIDGRTYRVTLGGSGWRLLPTGLPASGALAAVAAGSQWPVGVTSDGHGIGVGRVVDRVWTRTGVDLAVPGPIDAVATGAGIVLYSIG